MATPAPFGLIPEKAGTKTISVCVNFSRSSDQIGAWRCVTKAWRGYRIHTARTWGQLARSLYSSVGSNAKLMFTILCTGRAVARVISLIYKKSKKYSYVDFTLHAHSRGADHGRGRGTPDTAHLQRSKQRRHDDRGLQRWRASCQRGASPCVRTRSSPSWRQSYNTMVPVANYT